MKASEHPEGAAVLCRCRGCNGVAFYQRQRLQVGERLKANNVIYKNGTNATSGDHIECGSCGMQLRLYDVGLGQEDIS